MHSEPAKLAPDFVAAVKTAREVLLVTEYPVEKIRGRAGQVIAVRPHPDGPSSKATVVQPNGDRQNFELPVDDVLALEELMSLAGDKIR